MLKLKVLTLLAYTLLSPDRCVAMVVLRIRGTFIDFKPQPSQDMTSDQVRKRSTSNPPKVGAQPDTTTDQQLHDQYLAGLIKRTTRLPLDVIQAKRLVHASCGNRAFDYPKSVSTDVPESASTADLEFQFEERSLGNFSTPPLPRQFIKQLNKLLMLLLYIYNIIL